MLTVNTGCRTAAAGGMTEQPLMAVLAVHLTTMTWYHLHFGSFKVSRSGDSANTGLLVTSSCTGERTFRSFITSFGNFRYSTTWNSNACRGSCYINYHSGSYRSTQGFSQLHCSNSNIGGYNYLSFWCDWDNGDGAVMMIGGGGYSCNRADHGIGITEADDASFHTSYQQSDFGDESGSGTLSYSLNLWYK